MSSVNLIDNSVANPGEMGWGVKEETLDAKHRVEASLKDQLEDDAPFFASRHAAKTLNEDNWKLVEAIQQQNNIESGFVASYLDKVLFNALLKWVAQIIGSCVASGWLRVVTRRMMTEVYLFDEPEEFFGTQLTTANNIAPYGPYAYRAGRKIAGINGRGDGSYCSAHTEGAMRYGILPCNAPGLTSDAFPEPQNSNTYRNWGAGDTFLNQFMAEAQKTKLLESARIKEVDVLIETLQDEKKPCMICSGWAFRPDYVHSSWKFEDGNPVYIYRRDTGNSWAHNMSIIGYAKLHNGEEYFFIENSWGMNAHKNGDFFVIPRSVMEAWIRVAEVMSVGDVDMTNSGPAIEE